MQNMNTRLFMKKHGAALVFSLCLMGAAAFTTVYTLNQAENTKEQVEQTTDLEEEARIQDANAAKNAKPADEAAVDGQDAKVSGSDLVGEVVENQMCIRDRPCRDPCYQRYDPALPGHEGKNGSP